MRKHPFSAIVRLLPVFLWLFALMVIDGGKIMPPGHGESPPDNAIAEFDLGTQHHAVPFVMYPKSIPWRLMERLAKVLARPDDSRRFVSAYFGGDFGVSYLSPEKTAALNSALPQEPFEPLDSN